MPAPVWARTVFLMEDGHVWAPFFRALVSTGGFDGGTLWEAEALLAKNSLFFIQTLPETLHQKYAIGRTEPGVQIFSPVIELCTTEHRH